MGYIYGLIDPRDYTVRYVGYSKNPSKRYEQHIKRCYVEKSTYKNNWLKSLLNLSIHPDICIIEECNEFNWKDKKTYWIDYYRKVNGSKLTNGTLKGGQGGTYLFQIGSKHDPKWIEWAKEHFSGKNNPFYNKTHSQNSREKIRKFNIGKTLSDETKKKISVKSRNKRVNSPSTHYGVNPYRNKWRARFYYEGKEIRLGVFGNELDAAKAYNQYVIDNDLQLPLNDLSICG